MKNKIKQLLMMKVPLSQICDVIAKHLIQKYNFKTIPGKKVDEIYIYKEGIFIEKGKDVIEEEAELILEEAAKTHTVSEIKNKIQRLTKISRKDMGCNDKNLICLNNGVLDLKTKQLYEHSKDYKFMSKLPIIYNPNAHCDKIFKFFSEILLDQDIDCIQEWFGYQLFREYNVKKAAIFRGEPDTGKTTFMNLLKNFVGDDNCSSISLQLIAQGKWQLVPLYHKHSNICDDLSEKDITDSGTFKQVTGRSLINAEVKFGDTFVFENYAKLSFACNKIPAINSDVDDKAYWDRWLIFDFETVFEKDDKNTDINMIHNLTNEYELSGLLNWAIEGLERLHKKGFFSYKRCWEENRRIMQGEASSVAKFVNEALINTPNHWVSNKEVFDKYVEFCDLNSITKESDQKFAKELRKYCDFGKFGANKGNVFGVRNVKIKSVLPIFGI